MAVAAAAGERAGGTARISSEPPGRRRAVAAVERKVAVVYYLCRNGQLEQPHFMEVPLHPAADGMFLRDVMNRLDFLRGKGMASMYSWSSKRSYRNGFVWQDLTEDDFVHPAHGSEYVLKGSEILHGGRDPAASGDATLSSSSGSEKLVDVSRSTGDDSAEHSIPPPRGKKKKQAEPWTSLDLAAAEYKVYKAELTAESATKATDASTQTDEKKHRRPPPPPAILPTELEIDEISPPPSSSSPETLESLIVKANNTARVVVVAPPAADDRPAPAPGGFAGARSRASAVLMHLISCGSISVKDHAWGIPLVPPRPPDRSAPARKKDAFAVKPAAAGFPSVCLEDREYFSGSIVETKKIVSAGGDVGAVLKRSSSYNADRGSTTEGTKTTTDGVRSRCIPTRNVKTTEAADETDGRESGALTSRGSSHGSKRIVDEPRASKAELL